MPDADVYEVGEGEPPSPPRRSPWVAPVVGALLVAAVAGGVVAAREGAVPEAVDTPAATAGTTSAATRILDEDGFAQVRLGMRASDYLRLYQSGDQSGRRFAVAGTDPADGCVQYEYDDPASDAVVWTWVRDEVVVTVGIELRRYRSSGGGAQRSTAGTVPSAFGDRFEEVARDPVGQRRNWQRLEEGGASVLVGTTPSGEVRLAGLRRDGNVDSALVSLPAAAACDRDAEADLATTTTTRAGGAIEGAGASGAALGDTVATFRAGGTWTENTLVGTEGCRVFVADGGATALVSGDRVVALTAASLAGGPAVGDTVASAQGTVPPSRSTRVSVDQLTGRLVAESADLDDGRRLTLTFAPRPVLVDALDRVYALGPDVVTAVTVGEPCR